MASVTSDNGVADSRCEGMKNAFAITVGTTALPMTVATRYEYCAWEMMPWLRPKSAEIVPNVRPGDIFQPDREQRGDERETDPERREKPHVLHAGAFIRGSVVAGSTGRHSPSRSP